MISILVSVVVLLIVFGLIIWLVEMIPLPPQVVWAVRAILVLILILILLGYIFPGTVPGFGRRG